MSLVRIWQCRCAEPAQLEKTEFSPCAEQVVSQLQTQEILGSNLAEMPTILNGVFRLFPEPFQTNALILHELDYDRSLSSS
jgi:hypothetical protein